MEKTNFLQVLEDQPYVIILDDRLKDPENRAMLQALYSRSSMSAVAQLTDLEKGMKDADKFMDKYYIGFAHKSIGDGAETTMFIENVSMLAAKAIQDNPLYRGQECSTRYIDFATQRFHNPKLDLAKGVEILDKWRYLYLYVLEAMVGHFEEKFKSEKDEKGWKNACKAKALDVARGFLPAGTTTNLSWTTDFRQAADKIEELLFHPLAEVRDIANRAVWILSKLYPGSFEKLFKKYNDQGGKPRYSPGSYFSRVYHYPDNIGCAGQNTINTDDIPHIEDMFRDRQRGTLMPKWMRRYGTVTFQETIDFGSFRDLQRHRAAVIPNVMLGMGSRIHPWYLEQIKECGDKVYHSVLAELNNQQQATENFLYPRPLDGFDLMYYLPMGTMVDMEVTMDIGQMIYMLELRSYVGVHPTVRAFMEKVYQFYLSLGINIPVHIDDRPSGPLYLKRGTQTITKK